MEINKYTDITGVVVLEDIVDGRMVLLTSHSQSINFGSQTDLPGAKLPDDATDAKKAHFVVTHAVDNTKPPIYVPYPQLSFALRGGFDQSANVPLTSVDVHLTPLSVTEGRTIPSGALALAFGPGVFTVPSGAFIYSADVEVPGTWLQVSSNGADAGKLEVDSDYSEGGFAQVERYNSTDNKLTFRLNW
jgi:hypothetical protein